MKLIRRRGHEAGIVNKVNDLLSNMTRNNGNANHN